MAWTVKRAVCASVLLLSFGLCGLPDESQASVKKTAVPGWLAMQEERAQTLSEKSRELKALQQAEAGARLSQTN